MTGPGAALPGVSLPIWARINARQLDVLELAGLDRAEIAERLGLERNAVRAFLSELQRGGLWHPETGERCVTLGVHPYAKLFPMLGPDDLNALAEDIAANGLAQKVVLTGPEAAPLVLDGRNRLAALRMTIGGPQGDVPLSFLARHCEWFTGPDALAFVLTRNLTRRHLTESQRAMVAARLATMGHGGARRVAAIQAADLPVEHEGDAPSTTPIPPPSPQGGREVRYGGCLDAAPSPQGGRELGGASGLGVTQGAAAERLSISERAVRAAKVVIDKGGPALAGAVTRGDIAVSVAETMARQMPDVGALTEAEISALIKARREAKQEAKRDRRAAREQALAGRIAAGNAALQRAGDSAKKYGVIYADPEWQFDAWSKATGMDRAADNHYPTSTVEVIAARPVANIAADDCVLFLWAPAPMLQQALAVMKAWGFEYKSNLVWDKVHIITGYWFRGRHEHLLVGVRGDVPCPAMGDQWASVLTEARGKHSAKPAVFYDLIEDYFPELPKIELNARQARPGWDVWGAEAPDQSDDNSENSEI